MELVENPYVSDFTKATLEQFGWRVNDPIPSDLGELLLQIKDRLPPSTRIDVLIDAAAMTEEDVEKVKKSLKDAKTAGKKKEEDDKIKEATADMAPSVAAAYQKMLETQIVDDREDMPAAAAEPAADANTAPVVVVQSDDDAQVEEAPPPPPEGDVAGPMVVLPFCPRCGWNMQQKFDVDVSDQDKEDFLVTLLGGGRFTRDYELAGGRMVVRLRSLLADENFLIQRQLLLDQNAGEIFSEAEWFLRLSEYRLACSLAAILDSNGKPTMLNPALADVKFTAPADQPNQTALPTARQFINTKALAHEVTRRLISTHLRRFQRLVEALEAMALEPSFWNGIGSQP
jgi:hypothetical protein